MKTTFVVITLMVFRLISADPPEGDAAGVINGHCATDPPNCDGIGVLHFPLHTTVSYALEGWWDLTLSRGDTLPQENGHNVTLKGHVSLTRLSTCQVKVLLRNVIASDWKVRMEQVEVMAVVSGGVIQRICGHEPSNANHEETHHLTHTQSLARSIVSASLNVAPHVDDHSSVMTETDQFGECETEYSWEILITGQRHLKRARNLANCREANNNKNDKIFRKEPRSSARFANSMIWECNHWYAGSFSGAPNLPEDLREEVDTSLQTVSCHQSISTGDHATYTAHLDMSLIDSHSAENSDNEEEVLLEELNLDPETYQPEADHTAKVRLLLTELCAEGSQHSLPRAAMVYPRLLSEVGHLPSNDILSLYDEVVAGTICTGASKRVKSLYSAVIRDSASAAAAAAKCHLMSQEEDLFSITWTSSLANVHNPTTDAINTCAVLLNHPRWQEAVLGISTMVGKAAQVLCSRTHCNLDSFTCSEDAPDMCTLKESIQHVTRTLINKLDGCVAEDQATTPQVLIAIRGLGNLRSFGFEGEDALQLCGGNTGLENGLRVAAISALGRGPCSKQSINWLRWEVLNETVSAELRISAFQALHTCSHEQAEVVATLLMKRESDAQVKSYVSTFVTDGEKTKDDWQFSSHMLANLTEMLGVPDTILETDVIFEKSFLPRNIAFNLSSALLKDFGGNAQFGGRLERVEDLLQSLFGHKGLTGGMLNDWLEVFIQKVQELFAAASQEFVQTHEREKRSYSLEDVTALLKKVKHEAVTELRGWVYAGLGGQERLFASWAFNPIAFEWETLFNTWLEQLLETSYKSLINSNVELTTGWAEVDDKIWTWGLFGTPLVISQQDGGVVTLGASSQVDLVRLLLNPNSAVLNFALKPSFEGYSLSEMKVASAGGDFSTLSSILVTAGFDAKTIITIQGSDNFEVKVDIPQESNHGVSVQVTHSVKFPSVNEEVVDRNGDSLVFDENFLGETYFKDQDCQETDDSESRDARGRLNSGRKAGCSHFPNCNRSCNKDLDMVLGIQAKREQWWSRGKHVAGVRSRYFLRKSEDNISGYTLRFSWKNPGSNSLFLDVHVEAEGSNTERKAGLVFGLTYSPHFTVKVLLHSQQFSASGEVSLVNDPNMKRVEGRVGYGQNEYGFKAELLLVTDGGQVSVKPRFVIMYPSQQEDALLEGYMARYLSDKVSSVTLDLYTEGSLKRFIDVALKGTAEYRAAEAMDKTVTLKNIHVASPLFTLGLEATFALKDNGIETKIQVTWNGQVVVLDSSATNLSTFIDDEHYEVKFQMLLPDHPHLDTRITCITRLYSSEMTNNFTMMIGQEVTRQEFQVIHSTSWRITYEPQLLSNPYNSSSNATSGPASNVTQVGDHSVVIDQTLLMIQGIAVIVNNNLEVTSHGTDLNWKLNHILQFTDKSLENAIVAQIGDKTHKVMGNLYDQSDDLFKYHMEIEIDLPMWHFSYVDTLQQRYEGDVIGQSTTTMPSGRIYTTSSRFYKNDAHDTLELEFSYDILVRDGLNTIKIACTESFEWNPDHISLQMAAEVGDTVVFGLEMSLDGLTSESIEFYLKNWAKDLYESEVSLMSAGSKTDFTFGLIVIPFNREIKSKLAVGHDGCSQSVDGELQLDARGDTSQTLTVSSVIQLPNQEQTLHLKGSLSFHTWTWKTELQVVLGKEVGDNHKVTFILVLPDDTSFQAGSHLNFSVRNTDMDLSTGFAVRMPSGDAHNVTVLVRGLLAGSTKADGLFKLSVQSPITEDIDFHVDVKKQKIEERSEFGMLLRTSSAANYWDPIELTTTGNWDGTRGHVTADGLWGEVNLHFVTSGTHTIIEGEHRVDGSAELRIPLLESWSQLKSSLSGSFAISHNPGRMRITHIVTVEKDFEEVFNTEGEVSVHVPKAEGRLTITHAGSLASNHVYVMEGTFTGKELEVEIDGLVDDVPLKTSIHYIDGQEVDVRAYYRDEAYFSVAVKTELKDISIGIRKGNGTSYSLTTEGQLIHKNRKTKLHHQLSVTPVKASSVLKLSSFLGRVLKLTTSRTKIGHNHWSTLILLNWGNRRFRYRDDVHIPSYSECTAKVYIDAPLLNINNVTAKLEIIADDSGERAMEVIYQEYNVTIHSARMLYYNYNTTNEKVWRIGASQVVVKNKPYSDLVVYHAITRPLEGVQIKSNMTIGATPVIGVGVTVTPDTRTLLLSFCTTGEECIRLKAHAHARSTPSSRTFSVTAHALNSLFWSTVEDPLLQNSITFTAMENPSEVMVTGGIRRVECVNVTCEEFVIRGILHGTLHVTQDTMELLLDTTNRTVKVWTVIRESQTEEVIAPTLPGGRLLTSSTCETLLWMDRDRDPTGVISWKSTVTRYGSSQAFEWFMMSSLHHELLEKPLTIQGHILPGPISTNAVLSLDVFTDPDDALKVDLELLHNHGNHILTANLSKPVDEAPRLMDVKISFLPSPDSGEVSVVMVLPDKPIISPSNADRSITQSRSSKDAHFALTCGLDAGNKYASAYCKLVTPSDSEKISMDYHLRKGSGCHDFSTSIGLFNCSYNVQQKSCQNPTGLETSLSAKSRDGSKEELAFRLGLLDSEKAELDILDIIHLRFKLHPPFLLHTMGHSHGSIQGTWEEFKIGVQEEFDNIVMKAKFVMKTVARDVEMFRSLGRLSAPSPLHTLAEYTHTQSQQLQEELEVDDLLLDVIHGAKACVDITSVIVEAGVAYITHNFGDAISALVDGSRAWAEAVMMNFGSWLVQTVDNVHDALVHVGVYLSSIPQMIADSVTSLPLIGDAIQWTTVKIRQVKGSAVFIACTRIVTAINNFVHQIFSMLFNGDEENTSAENWNFWIPLPECGHSLLDVWNYIRGQKRTAHHQLTLPAAIVHWWHLLTHPADLIAYIMPPYTAHGAIIGETSFITLDGQAYSLTTSCAHIIVTDARDGLFTLTSEVSGTNQTRQYTLLLGNTSITLHHDFQVTIDESDIILPYTSDIVSISRNLQHIQVTALDPIGRTILKLTCWISQQACVVSVSGWLHADTRGLMGNLDLNPTDDLMRPSGKVALSGEVFSKSWQVNPQGSNCPDVTNMEVPLNIRAYKLCHKSLLHYSSPVFPCHDSVNIKPFFDTCIRQLTSLQEESNTTPNRDDFDHFDHTLNESTDDMQEHDIKIDAPSASNAEEFENETEIIDSGEAVVIDPSEALKISVRDIIFPLSNIEDDLFEATKEEFEAICDVMAAYTTTCSQEDIKLSLPRVCGLESKLTYKEPLSTEKQLDLILLVDEGHCDDFIYSHLIRPFPAVLERIAQAKNVSDIQMAVLGYGAGGGDIVYHSFESSILTLPSQLVVRQPQDQHLPRGTLVQGMKSISRFPFRPGSVRIALAVRCSTQDLPQFTETLPKEMNRRRLTLFTLTPDLLMFSPTRPKAVRNTIGLDRWRVYNLRDDRQQSIDSWGARRPKSNVAQLALKSGGGVFTVTPLRSENKSTYYMKLFRKVLSRAILKVVNNVYKHPTRTANIPN